MAGLQFVCSSTTDRGLENSARILSTLS